VNETLVATNCNKSDAGSGVRQQNGTGRMHFTIEMEHKRRNESLVKKANAIIGHYVTAT
jgi:hypothetical protein